MSDVDRALRNLRHLYEQMLVDGCVRDTKSAATGLLGPAIEAIERFVTVRCATCGDTIAEPCYYPGSGELCDACGASPPPGSAPC